MIFFPSLYVKQFTRTRATRSGVIAARTKKLNPRPRFLNQTWGTQSPPPCTSPTATAVIFFPSLYVKQFARTRATRPQDYAKSLNNQQAIRAKRALVEVLAGMALNNLANPCGNTQVTCGVVLPLGLGSTGRTIAVNLREQLAMEEVMANPKGTKLPLRLRDERWSAGQGWVKMSQTVNGVEIHWVENTLTGAVDDFKFIK